MSNNESGHQGGNFLQGLLWGAIIGGGIVFLLGTKKGKRLLKIITEEGLENISDIGELVEDELEEYEEEPIVTQGKQMSPEDQVVRPESPVQQSREVEKPTGVKRLFRGIRKKS